MRDKIIASLMLLTTAVLWGSGFAFRKIAMEYLTPMFVNGVRFFVGGLFILIIFFIFWDKKKLALNFHLRAGFIAGLFIFGASAFQMLGMATSDAGTASFITSLYIVMVPLISFLFLKTKIEPKIWLCVVLAIFGMLLLTLSDGMAIGTGEILLLICTLFFALHILVVGTFTKELNGLLFAAIQMLFCGFFNFVASFIFEDGNSWEGISQCLGQLLYLGILVSGIAYLFQTVAQKKISSSITALILSLESVFGAVFGAILLGETMSFAQISGCVIILIAIVGAQIDFKSLKGTRLK